MWEWILLLVLVGGSTAWVFWLGYEYGQYKAEPPPCRRRHKDEP
jgi:hypothetical protein